MTRRRFKQIAWLSLAAMLFSAVSPAIAATLLKAQPRALARMLGIPAAEEALSHEGHEGHAGHAMQDDGTAPQPSKAPHPDHGIYCSLCLNATSTVALASVAASPIVVLPARTVAADEAQQTFQPAFLPFFRSRAPPAL